MNPLDLRGPEFLLFYVKWAVAILVVGYALRLLLAKFVFPGPAPGAWAPGRFPKEGEAYLVAYLRGGGDEVVRTLLARLAASELVDFDTSGKRPTTKAGVNLAPMEARALAAVAPLQPEAKDAFVGVRDAVAGDIASIDQELTGAGLIPARGDRLPFLALLAFALLALPGLGVAKLVVALERGRTNVGYLTVLTVLFAFVCLKLFQPPRRTRAGDEYLRWLRESHHGLKATIEKGRRTSAGEVGLCVAIFGLAALSGLRPIESLRGFLKPKMTEGWFSSCGSGCGSGGGCGGGGCGGGGCGGCGG